MKFKTLCACLVLGMSAGYVVATNLGSSQTLSNNTVEQKSDVKNSSLGKDRVQMSEEAYNKWMKAVHKGNIEKITKYITEKGYDVNAHYPGEYSNETALQRVARGRVSDCLEIAELLLDNGADPDLGNPLSNALSAAKGVKPADESSKLKMIELLLKHGADPNKKYKYGSYPLIDVLENDDMYSRKFCIKVVELLVKHNADKNVKNDKGETALTIAEKKGYKDLEKLLQNDEFLTSAKREMNSEVYNQWMFAVRKGDIDEVRDFIERKKYDVNAHFYNHGWANKTALECVIFCSENTSVEIARLLLKNGADAEIIKKMGAHAIETIISDIKRRAIMNKEDVRISNMINMIKFLLENGANSNDVKLTKIVSAVSEVTYEPYLKVVKLLMEYGANKDEKDENGETALMIAEKKGYKEFIEKFKTADGPLLDSISDSESDLSSDRQPTLLDSISDSESDLNSNEEKDSKSFVQKHKMTDEEWNQWIRAAQKGDIETINRFIEKGVSVDETKYPFTALGYAASHGYEKMVDILIAKGADVNYFDETKPGAKSILAAAASKSHLPQNVNIVNTLLSYGADPNKYNKKDSFSGRTPLMEAVSADFWESGARDNIFKVISMLLSNGADPNLEDFAGRTVLDYAEENEIGEKIIDLLKEKGAKNGHGLKGNEANFKTYFSYGKGGMYYKK